MRTIKIGLVGCGTVGSGVVKIIQTHSKDFAEHQGIQLEIAKIASRTRAKIAALGISAEHIADSYREIIKDPEIDIVIELIGGTTDAFDIIIAALSSGKSVVTANKALMASRGSEIFACADAHNAQIAFEAAVGGGIPIIAALKHSLTGNAVDSLMGIVNGTTNYMLTRMNEAGLDYDSAVLEAQEKGYAEADPSADVDGFDAAAKIAILASIAFNSRVSIDNVPVEGIRSIRPVDFQYANEMGYALKLLAIAHKDTKIDVRVHPTMIPMTHPLASVNGVYNAIFVHGDAVGNLMFFGEGAGSGPAASAVMGDVIELARSLALQAAPAIGCTCTDHLEFHDPGDLLTNYYIRILVDDAPGVLAQISKVFGDKNVSIRSMVQQRSDGNCAQLIFVTHDAREAFVISALKEIKTLPTVCEIGTVIRIEGD